MQYLDRHEALGLLVPGLPHRGEGPLAQALAELVAAIAEVLARGQNRAFPQRALVVEDALAQSLGDRRLFLEEGAALGIGGLERLGVLFAERGDLGARRGQVAGERLERSARLALPARRRLGEGYRGPRISL
ncbi:MAG: hypothetical protein H6739_19385 [Alphaproteobacteria bacterium]|nr:hypothetical protein [Alphaproteobacteria bacterium]